MAQRILIPLDGTDTSESIIPEVHKLRPPDGEIHLLHVPPSRRRQPAWE